MRDQVSTLKVKLQNPKRPPIQLWEVIQPFLTAIRACRLLHPLERERYYNDTFRRRVAELVDWHSTYINPKELAVNAAFYELLAGESTLKELPLVRHYLTLTQYSKDKTRDSAAGPATGALVDPTTLGTLCSKKSSRKVKI